ncbi:MAG: dihydropyrimidinase [Polyangiaceae bacterium]|nr:dihydropyrimidinase [Polyangiaceae bacterium]
MLSTLIKGGTVVTATDTYAADVVIINDKIAAIFGPEASPPGPWDITIDAVGKFVMPGGIDVHTHLDMPFGGTTASDDFESGTRAAAHGGTTCIVDFAIQPKNNGGHGSLRSGLDAWHRKAEGKAAIDYAFHMIMTDVTDDTIAEMGRVVSEGVTSFKVFMAYPGALLVDDGQIFRTMQRSAELGALICVHAENGFPIDILVEEAIAKGHTAPVYHGLTRPEIAEAEATHRAICLAEMANAPVYIVHLSAERSLDEVVRARDRGLPVFAETCPQYLFLSDDDLARPDFEGAKYVCSPPLRPRHMQEDLWRGLRTGNLQVVSTDHCPFNQKGQKEMGKNNFAKIPNGLPGVETRLSLLWNSGVRQGRISKNRFVEITSTAPAKIFGLYPKKGTIAVGADADLLIWDGDKRHTLNHANLHMRVDYSPYEGVEVMGAPSHVISRGKLVVDHGQYIGKKGDGQFVKRATFSYI